MVRGRILPNTYLVTLDFPALNIMTMIDNGVCTSALIASGVDPYLYSGIINRHHMYVFFPCISTTCIPCRQVLILLLLKE